MTLAPLPSPLIGPVAVSAGACLTGGARAALTDAGFVAEPAFADIFEEADGPATPGEKEPVFSHDRDNAPDSGSDALPNTVGEEGIPDTALALEGPSPRDLSIAARRFDAPADLAAKDRPVPLPAARWPAGPSAMVSDRVQTSPPPAPVSAPIARQAEADATACQAVDSRFAGDPAPSSADRPAKETKRSGSAKPGEGVQPLRNETSILSDGRASPPRGAAMPKGLIATYTPPKAKSMVAPLIGGGIATEQPASPGNQLLQGKSPPVDRDIEAANHVPIPKGMRAEQSLILPKTSQDGSNPSALAGREVPAKTPPAGLAPPALSHVSAPWAESDVKAGSVPHPETEQRSSSAVSSGLDLPSTVIRIEPGQRPPDARRIAGAVAPISNLALKQALFRPESSISGDSIALDFAPGSLPMERTAVAHHPETTGPRPGLIRHVAYQLADAVARGTDRPVDLTLNPQELGRVRLSLTMADGAIAMTIIAERPETLDLMRRHIDQLAQEFRDLGYGNIQFSFGQYRQGSGDDSPPQPPRPQVDVSEMPGPPPVPGSVRGETALDIRV